MYQISIPFLPSNPMLLVFLFTTCPGTFSRFFFRGSEKVKKKKSDQDTFLALMLVSKLVSCGKKSDQKKKKNTLMLNKQFLCWVERRASLVHKSHIELKLRTRLNLTKFAYIASDVLWFP